MSNLANDRAYWASPEPFIADVLVLDDSQFDRKRIRRALSKLPAAPNVTEAADLVGLDEALKTKDYDVILVDYALADGDGMQALAKIKDSGRGRNARVVMVTGNDSSSLAVIAMKLGFDDYVTKDNFDTQLLSKLLVPMPEKGRASVIPFPARIAKRTPEPSQKLEFTSALSLEQMLQPAINAAIDQAMARVRMDEMADNVVGLIVSLAEEDEFIFKNLQ